MSDNTLTDNVYVAAFFIDENLVLCDIKSVVVIFVYRYLGQVCPSVFRGRLFIVIDKTICPDIVIEMGETNFTVIDPSDVISYSSLPALMKENDNFCVAGLSAVIRQLFKTYKDENTHISRMLGYKEASLTACPEFSIHTKLCNFVLIESFKKVAYEIHQFQEIKRMPEFLIAVNNILRLPAQIADSKDARKTDSSISTTRPYLEGSQFALSDIIALPAVFIFWNIFTDDLKSVVPLRVVHWYNRVLSEFRVTETLDKLSLLIMKSYNILQSVYLPTDCLITSYCDALDGSSNEKENDPHSPDLYISEEELKKYTKQKDIEEAINKIDREIELKSPADCLDKTFRRLIWSNIPESLYPIKGNRRPYRKERKMEQVENLISFVMKIHKPNDVIVDFCCGMGYVGLVLAYLLPQCTIILLDNKEYSLEKVAKRVAELNLKNVFIIQSNVDNFVGNFQIGAALHACGVATDLVILKCIQQKAHFVVSPCCYGKIRENPLLSYPRSDLLLRTDISKANYKVLTHSADQTHKIPCVKSEQGEKCMDIVDTDRCLQARQHSYNAHLYKMNPLSSTPKHNIIVGILEGYEYNKDNDCYKSEFFYEEIKN